MLLTPIESRDLIGAYKRDNLEEAIVHLLMIIDPAKDRYLTTSCVDMWYEVIQLFNSAVHLVFMGGQSHKVTIKTPRLLSVFTMM